MRASFPLGLLKENDELSPRSIQLLSHLPENNHDRIRCERAANYWEADKLYKLAKMPQ